MSISFFLFSNIPRHAEKVGLIATAPTSIGSGVFCGWGRHESRPFDIFDGGFPDFLAVRLIKCLFSIHFRVTRQDGAVSVRSHFLRVDIVKGREVINGTNQGGARPAFHRPML
ncbi:MAG: hypothetical protein SGI71_10610 [Verrucomicrobiota bacterium]|nr:hypothetical protein [Verrucomicrobiota bacterium]